MSKVLLRMISAFMREISIHFLSTEEVSEGCEIYLSAGSDCTCEVAKKTEKKKEAGKK